ncbi:MAG: LLM class flavin-dependent oxidoreductase [Acidimicrobiia bacterium]|nr:LLM class flavin-dependent oxidoreductase [Acidimicrobiia bacterium]
MQVGIQLPEIERVVPRPEYRDMAVAAEELGYASLWVGDHLLYDKPEGSKGPWECWSLLAALAAVTQRVLLGPLVTPTGFRNPALLAKMAGTVDEISDGRLVLGLGSGWNRREYDAFGFPYDKRVSRFEEAYAIIVSLIRTGHADFSGTYHSNETNSLIPPPRPGMPIMIGSTGPRMLGIGAPHMDWWNEWWNRFGNTVEGLRPLTERVDAAVTAAGRDPGEITKSVALHVALPGGGGRLMGANVDSSPITGNTDEMTEVILRFAELVDHVQLVVDPITIESIETLAPVVSAIHAAA